MNSIKLSKVLYWSLNLLVAIALVLSLQNCSGEQSQQKTAEDDIKSEVTPEKDQQKEVDSIEKEVKYPVPTPFEITTMLNKAGASYIVGLSNPIENADNYITEAGKALNLGTYGTDLSYACVYNNVQQINVYLEKFHRLTDELGVKSLINKDLIDRVEQNITNLDSMHNIISVSYYDTFDYLNQEGKGDIATLVLTGGWIEGLYISSQLAKSAVNKTEILKGIAQEKESFNELTSLTGTYKDQNEDVATINKELLKLQPLFDKLSDEGSIAENDFTELTNTIETIRAGITE